ncbi:competence type IV pilus major pilin ComGC [Aquibacillus kalidii]|uniref:competence type IV pilus major pilin ComGC n=1 Tax=Aquibacillus kalidii TaxID=2762597 RepID=UPI001648114F|nr:competence type IV pilus major pilin ComGC [Aquibacillus kalidii]
MLKIREKGFTLIEMLIVLAIISTLLILLVPNLAEKNNDVQSKGCNALKQMAENQLQAYKIDHNNTSPTDLHELVTEKYLQTDTCANNSKKVQLSSSNTNTIEIVNNQ